jgi:hypothetical protein
MTGKKAKTFYRWDLPIASEDARQDTLKRFYILRALQEVCLKTPKEPP